MPQHRVFPFDLHHLPYPPPPPLPVSVRSLAPPISIACYMRSQSVPMGRRRVGGILSKLDVALQHERDRRMRKLDGWNLLMEIDGEQRWCSMRM